MRKFALKTVALLLVTGPIAAQAPTGSASGATDPRAGTTASSPASKPKPVRNLAFYNAEVPVSSQNAAERRGATIRALGQVVVRLTGNPQAAGNPVIRRAASNIDGLATKSSFRQDNEPVNGVPVYKTVLTVSFDPDAVDALIGSAGLKFWTANRPKPILWLAIDDGRGARLVTGQQTAVVKPLATRGLERGMRFLLPAGTSVEQASLRSILTLNAPAMQVLTSRYRNDAQLIGKVYRQPPGWAADWLLTQQGVELARWSFADSDPRRVIASGVDESANAFAKRDAVGLDTGVAGLYSIEIGGVNTQADYLKLMAYLPRLPSVRKVTVIEAVPGQLRVQLDLSVGMKGFRTLLGTDDVLVPAIDAGELPGTGTASRFTLQ